MKEFEAEAELQRRFYYWAKKFVEREVAEDFPAFRACDLHRRVQCFRAWPDNLDEKERLTLCLSLGRRARRKHLVGKSGDLLLLMKKCQNLTVMCIIHGIINYCRHRTATAIRQLLLKRI